jgi:hypothetical protein
VKFDYNNHVISFAGHKIRLTYARQGRNHKRVCEEMEAARAVILSFFGILSVVLV